MKRILKNINGKETIDTNYQGNKVVIRPKCAYATDHPGEATYLLSTYGFLVDITPRVKHPIGEVKKARGVKHDRS